MKIDLRFIFSTSIHSSLPYPLSNSIIFALKKEQHAPHTMVALSSPLHRDSQQSIPRRLSSKNDRGLPSVAPHMSTASPTTSQSSNEDYNFEGKAFL